MTERIQNYASSYMGGAKQTVGETLGYPDLAASGSAQKSQADMAQNMADAKTYAEGLGNKVQGEVQKTVGSLTNDPAMEVRGHTNVARGEVQRNL
ncbi:hypothetical protein BGZ83_002809 [Gryganskiella cystojenkinii]|nr:hypothetical protein BGZ83_002809 [Gryganskiella cystojenkinii]